MRDAGGGAEALERLLEVGLAAVFGQGKRDGAGLGGRKLEVRCGRRLGCCAASAERRCGWRATSAARATATASLMSSLGRKHGLQPVYNPVSAFGSCLYTLSTSADTATLERRIGLRSAVLFNMLEMIGVGPFITLPLVIAAAGFRLSVWAWVLGAAIAVADGLVWAELGAAFPRAGGSYAFLREIYGPDRAGNWLSFLYVWQLSFSAPLSIASGCIGLSSFLGMFWPGLDGDADCGVADAALLELCRGCCLPADDVAALSKPEDGDVDGVGDVCRRAGVDCGRDRVRVCARRRPRAAFICRYAPRCRCMRRSAGWRRGRC